MCSVDLPDSFQNVTRRSVLSLLNFYCLYDIDVNSALFPTEEHHIDYIENIESSVSSVVIPHWTCNDASYTQFDFSRFTNLETLEIGDECFGSVEFFRIDGLRRLKSITIGINSFTKEKNDYGDDESKSFHILNCESLESIDIGEYSFSDFGGEFELKNLPKLQSIQIGTVGSRSFNFCDCSFVVQGLFVLHWYYVDFPSLTSITLGDLTFGYSVYTVLESNCIVLDEYQQIFRYCSLSILVNVRLLEGMKMIPVHLR